MIEALCFTRAWRGFAQDTWMVFEPGVNLLVGDQGCGKSTILQAIAEHGKVKSAFWKRDARGIADHTRLVVSASKKVWAHDFEQDSPRTAPSMNTMGMLKTGIALRHLWMSHGQATRDLVEILARCEDSFVLLDEPDAGISPRTAGLLVAALKASAAKGSQVIAAVHHPWVIAAFERVLSVEHRKWMPADAFLATQRSGAPVEPAPEST